MKTEDKYVHLAIITSIKNDFVKLKWWDEVQSDVQDRLEWVLDNLPSVGTLFASSFMTLFRWEYERRRVSGEKMPIPMTSYTSVLLGMKVNEEAYQCGRLPVRSVLDLYDYIEPNDSDVAACLMLCNKIDILERSGILASVDELKTSTSDMSEVLHQPSKKKDKANSELEECIEWDDDADDDTPTKKGELN